MVTTEWCLGVGVGSCNFVASVGCDTGKLQICVKSATHRAHLRYTVGHGYLSEAVLPITARDLRYVCSVILH